MAVAPFTTRSDLLLGARQLAVLVAPYSVGPLTTLENPATGALSIPNAFVPLGLLKKSVGATLSNTPTINDIESHGKGTPQRQIPTKRVIQVGFNPQETNRYNLERYWGADFSSVTYSAQGGVAMAVPDLPINARYRVILLGQDDYQGSPIYLYWIGNRVNIAKTEDLALTDGDIADYPYTLNFESEDSLGSALTVGICGPGWKLLGQNVVTGFGS